MQRQGRTGIAAIALAGAVAIAIALATGCDDASKKQPTPTATSGDSSGNESAPEDSASDLASRGERVYNINCIACHHRDPTLDGGLGPPVAGSSRELIEARVMRGEYPPGYTPRADTTLMIPLPHLEPELDALAAFLENRAN